MIVNETALMKLMKASYNSSGYHVAVLEIDHGWMVLSGGGWMVLLKPQSVPRKILGYIAETVGALPNLGQAYRVRKKMAELEQREVIEGSVQSMKDIFVKGPSWKIKPTDLTMGGNELWQNCGTMDMVLMDPALTDIIGDSRVVTTMAGDYIYAEDSESAIYLARLKTTEGSAKYLEHLSKALWVAVT